MYIALQKVKRPRVLLSSSLLNLLRRLSEDAVPASIIHRDPKTKFVRHVKEYTP